MIEGWLARAADNFWDMVAITMPFPRDLETIISRGFPISTVALPHLSVRRIETWLRQYDVPYRFLCHDRALCGCIIAARGHGLLFVDTNDPANERRFTIAHEVAHYVLDYLYPRQHALQAFGEVIRPVLDAERAPTPAESIDAVLSSVCLGMYTDLMPRSAQGGIEQSVILRAEDRADRLALELLAPAEHVLAQLPASARISPFEQANTLVDLLVHTYGLPRPVARSYSVALLRSNMHQSTADWLGL